jgi:hypothetical protein
MSESANFPSPEQRVINTINQHQEASTQALSGKVGIDKKATEVEAQLSSLAEKNQQITHNLETLQNTQQERGILGKLGSFITGQSVVEQKQAQSLQKKLTNLETQETGLKGEAEHLGETKKVLEKKFLRESTLTEANKRNISRHEEGKKPPEERVVPITTSPEMRQALDRQREISDSIKFYAEYNYSDEPKYLMPVSLIGQLKQSIKESGRYINVPDKIIEKTIVEITPLYKEIIKLADEKKIPVNLNLINKAFTEGINITYSIGSSSVADFISEKLGKRAGWLDTSYYAMGAANLDRFFEKRKNIQGENRLPYVIAYATGVLVNKAPYRTAELLRDWIAETVPVPRKEIVYEKGQFVEKDLGSLPLGYGFFIKRQDDLKETRDEGVIEAMKVAREIVVNIDLTYKEKQLYKMREGFFSFFGIQEHDLEIPHLIMDKKS